MATQIQSAKAEDGTEYFVGDTVCIYQGRFGHNNIMKIVSMWDCETWIAVSETETLPGTNINAIKHKITQKQIKELQKARALVNKYR